jgi:hypothetical protein
MHFIVVGAGGRHPCLPSPPQRKLKDLSREHANQEVIISGASRKSCADSTWINKHSSICSRQKMLFSLQWCSLSDRMDGGGSYQLWLSLWMTILVPDWMLSPQTLNLFNMTNGKMMFITLLIFKPDRRVTLRVIFYLLITGATSSRTWNKVYKDWNWSP